MGIFAGAGVALFAVFAALIGLRAVVAAGMALLAPSPDPSPALRERGDSVAVAFAAACALALTGAETGVAGAAARAAGRVVVALALRGLRRIGAS